MPANIYKNSAGKRVPGVTTIIGSNLGWSKNALMYWAVKMMKQGINPIRERDKAAELGTLVHEYIEAHIYGASVSDEAKNKFSFEDVLIAEKGLDEFRTKEKSFGIEWKEVEMSLVSEELQYGGQIDGLCTFDLNSFSPEHRDSKLYEYLSSLGDPCPLILTDTKTSNSIYADHIIQLSAYRQMLLERTDYRPKGAVIIKVSKDKETIQQELDDLVKFVPVEDTLLDSAFELFKVLKFLHDNKKDMENAVKSLTEIKLVA